MNRTHSIDVETARAARLPAPSRDLAELSDRIGQAWGVSCGYSLPQYLAWGETTAMFTLLGRHEALTVSEISNRTELRESGVDALLGVFAALGVVSQMEDGEYGLTLLGREYLLPESPYYIGHGLFVDCTADIPAAYLRDSMWNGPEPRILWSVDERLEIQHSRNFGPTVVAVRSGHFDGVNHVVDIGGGTGVLAIPLALDHPGIRITMVDRPEVLATARKFLTRFGVEERVRLAAMDVFNDEWQFDSCDGVFFGNVFHSLTEEECRFMCRKAFEALSSGGRIWLHEVLFNDNRDGPLLAALWNVNMAAWKPGARQRTRGELSLLLEGAGFEGCSACPTAGGFSLVTSSKSAGEASRSGAIEA